VSPPLAVVPPVTLDPPLVVVPPVTLDPPLAVAPPVTLDPPLAVVPPVTLDPPLPVVRKPPVPDPGDSPVEHPDPTTKIVTNPPIRIAFMESRVEEARNFAHSAAVRKLCGAFECAVPEQL
jgi:hypothetical protein